MLQHEGSITLEGVRYKSSSQCGILILNFMTVFEKLKQTVIYSLFFCCRRYEPTNIIYLFCLSPNSHFESKTKIEIKAKRNKFWVKIGEKYHKEPRECFLFFEYQLHFRAFFI